MFPQILKAQNDISALSADINLKCNLSEITKLSKNLQEYPLRSDFTLLEEKMSSLVTLDQ